LACQAPNNGWLASHCHERLYTLGVDGDRRRKRMDNGGEKGRMTKEREFPLLEMLRPWVYSIESSESRCIFLVCFLLFL